MKFLDCLICRKKEKKRSNSYDKSDAYKELDRNGNSAAASPRPPSTQAAPPPTSNIPSSNQESRPLIPNGESEYALISSDSVMTTSATKILNENRTNEYESPEAIEAILSSNTTEAISRRTPVHQNPTDLYSLPKYLKDKPRESLYDDEDQITRSPPKKDFDPNLIYNSNKSHDDRINNNLKDTVDYYYTTTTATEAINNEPAASSENFYQPKNSSHYELVPDYDVITHMAADSNNNISRLNVTQNDNSNVRNIIVVEENYYSISDPVPTNENVVVENNNSIQYMDVTAANQNSETVNNRSTIVQVTNNTIESIKL